MSQETVETVRRILEDANRHDPVEAALALYDSEARSDDYARTDQGADGVGAERVPYGHDGLRGGWVRRVLRGLGLTCRLRSF